MLSTVEQLSTEKQQTHGLPWRYMIPTLLLIILLGGGFWWAKHTGTLANLLPGATTQSAATVPTNSVAGEMPFNPGDSSFTNGAGMLAPAVSNNQLSADPAASATGVSAPVTETQDQEVAITTPDERASATATVDATLSPHAIAVAGVQGTTLWGADGALLTTLEAGTKLDATGQSADGAWLMVTSASASGWAPTTSVIIFDQSLLAVTALPKAVSTAATQTDTPSEAVEERDSTVDNQNLTTAVAPATDSTLANNAATNNATATSAITATVVTAGARLNVRSGPGTSYAVATKIANGTTLTVLGRDESGAWLEVQLPDHVAATGWVAADYVTFSTTDSQAPVSSAEQIAAAN